MGRIRKATAVVAVGAVMLGGLVMVASRADAVTPSAPVFHGAIVKKTKVGKAFHTNISAKGSPIAAITATTPLPTGLTLVDLGTGKALLSGTFSAPGTYTVGLHAQNSQGSAAEDLTVSVTGTRSTNTFALSAAPTSASVVAGSATTSAISTAVTSGNPQTVALSAAGAPSGALVSFSPSSVTSGGGSTMTVTTASGTTPGTYPIYVVATGASATDSTIFSLTVTAIVSSAYCGFKAGAPTTTKTLVIFEENHDRTAVVGTSSAPNITSYANGCGQATDYTSLTHPSLPNYLAATSGLPYNTSPWTSDCQASTSGCNTTTASIFSQVGSSGWKSYAESMPSACDTSSSGSYVSRHNPAVYYTNVATACVANDVVSGTYTSGALYNDVQNGTLPTVGEVTPNLNDDMHDGTVAAADTWLSHWIPVITAGPDYQSGHLVIMIIGDEGSTGSPSSNPPAIFMSPYITPGTSSSTYFTHYSLLRAVEDVAGVPHLNSAATANDLRTAFHF